MSKLSKALLIFATGAVMLTSVLLSQPAAIVKASDSYPQMYTEYMLSVMPDIEKEHEVKFLGSYLDGHGNMIWWIDNLNTGKCEAFGRVGNNVRSFRSCGAAYEAYLVVCRQMGNCN